WTTVPPDPITSVRSFKIEFGSLVVQPFDFLEFTFSMVTPGDVPAGQPAFNSFAYQADRADGLGSLAAEPQKVGISLGSCEAASLGDFVWVDVNGDGVQNDGPTGLNDVLVRLFQPGADGIPGTLDDIPLSSIVTGPGPDLAPGWYRFPGLAPGSYLVCVTKPPTFEFTTSNQGADTADSDANPATGCSPVTVLAANEDNPTIDFGLVATELAALGNYVWFDRNSDGVQNESPFDGANGVTVRLFVDDGDGNPEPGTGDALVATTVTADDVYGQPGYYLFDGLIPGLRYFVQFDLPASATAFTSQNAGGDDTVDSDADAGNGTTATVILAPSEVNLTIDAGLVTATGTLALGDQVWMESDNDGVFEPQNGEMGVDGVRLNLYLDANGDGEPTLDEYIATTTTFTQSGFVGRYRFDNLAPGTYIVVVAPQSFGGGGALSGKVTATGNDPAPDPDDDANGDDNGTDVGALTASLPVTLTDNGEPTAEDGNNDTNLTVDFGFIPAGVVPVPEYDYGDAPDVIVGTAPGDYNTTALDSGAYHQVGVPNAPYLGACVDADGGFNQDLAASQDDTGGFGSVVGTCATGGDDEDGVSFNGPFAPGATASFTVTAGSTACTLSAWVDWNRNGVFDDAGEQIAADVAVSGAPTVLSPAVPAGAVPGLTYARFRCASAGGLSPTGPAADGEVEDYLVGILGTDFGDAPASYGTDGAGAASHAIDPLTTLFLGACVDTEADGQPNAAADGDDLTAGTSRVGNCFDDEDGVAFGGALIACQTGSVTITASAAGELDGFLDWSADGDFDDAGEQIFSGQSLAAGSNPLTFPIPCTAVTGGTYARFRLSSSGSPGPTGAAADGEVEDYLVNVGPVDFGDAPDTYGTLSGSNGPNHGLVAGFSLGATEDGESQGQPNVGATGDGADEDGVVLPNSSMITACSTVQVSVFLTNTAGIATPLLDAWIDFDGDGAFGDPRDRIATGLALVAGANNVTVNVPCDAQSAATYARFRLSSAGVSGPGGASPDGEVEDYALIGKGLDFGDAPDPAYPTLLASNGARHVVLPTGNPALGPTVDTEPNGQPGATLLGDDGTGSDDEDGVTFPAVLIPGTDGTIQLTTGTTGGTVSCWIDFEQDGDWSGPGEQAVTDAAIAASTVTSRTFPVPVGAPQGTAATRCRISSQTGLGVTGEAPDGEIEDHPAPVGVEAPALGVAKRLVSAVRDANLAQVVHVTFEIRVENAGNVPLSNLQVTEDLAATFVGVPSFTVTSVQSSTFAVNPGFNGTGDTNLLAAGNSLAVGMSGTITVAVRVDSGGNRGPFYNQVTGSGTSPGTRTVTDDSQDGPDPDPDGNDDPSDNDDPTVVILPISPHEIPTLGEWGLLAMAALLGLFALRRLRPARA
ncbi:MAG TPA: IPTL-CTERM sorting domain-containing protein, partial [Thermoanaerobaculia bacterium]|nr:IPTL-CTERM sorting domain-containing protein [Thermoanaerobaculia bacterium]